MNITQLFQQCRRQIDRVNLFENGFEMNKHCRSFVILAGAFAAMALPASAQGFPAGSLRIPAATPHREILLRIGDGPRFPAPEPKSGVKPTVQETIDAKLQARFDAATANSNHLLTARIAEAASWGFVAGHFGAIDKDHDGYATISEISAFLDARSPVKKKRQAEAVQVVE
jgi:hypothetical protein